MVKFEINDFYSAICKRSCCKAGQSGEWQVFQRDEELPVQSNPYKKLALNSFMVPIAIFILI